MAGHEGTPFQNITWLADSTDGPNTQCPIIDNGNQSQPYQPHIRYLPNKRNALQSHMQKVHKLGNAQTDTDCYAFYRNLIKNKRAHSKICYAFWSLPGISHEEKDTMIKYWSGMIYNQKHAVCIKQSNSLSCPICSCQDSAPHILSRCQHPIIRNIVTKRHNITGRLIT